MWDLLVWKFWDSNDEFSKKLSYSSIEEWRQKVSWTDLSTTEIVKRAWKRYQELLSPSWKYLKLIPEKNSIAINIPENDILEERINNLFQKWIKDEYPNQDLSKLWTIDYKKWYLWIWWVHWKLDSIIETSWFKLDKVLGNNSFLKTPSIREVYTSADLMPWISQNEKIYNLMRLLGFDFEANENVILWISKKKKSQSMKIKTMILDVLSAIEDVDNKEEWVLFIDSRQALEFKMKIKRLWYFIWVLNEA
ncbi:MAG: hypothetical protein ACD_4C00432G0001 [uncultured bacterium (gcode 4)]|uniref:Uncharacterized protein n=1 Tax=uncultured bacterium (gcode 4) TaxID=1234023 RepID=K2FTC1_9BACT|nr:MAG: hypothetical protein ACD_4C00432G0001 [uncultured bacterium (gcode 4)]